MDSPATCSHYLRIRRVYRHYRRKTIGMMVLFLGLN
jgi:hypothetical protein